MFDNVGARFALRAALVGVATFVGSLTGALPGIEGGEALEAMLVGVGASLAYAGIGAAVPAVEPSIGNKRR